MYCRCGNGRRPVGLSVSYLLPSAPVIIFIFFIVYDGTHTKTPNKLTMTVSLTATTSSASTGTDDSQMEDEPSRKRPRDSEITPLLFPSLYRLAEGIPRRELKLMVSEAVACEEALEKEINDLKESLESSKPESSATKKSLVDLMLETEVTPPDRYFTVSALLGRLRDVLATPLPPNSSLPALRAQNELLQAAPKKKKSNPNEPAASPKVENTPFTNLKKQQQLLALKSNPHYTREHTTPTALLALLKKISAHRLSAVFRRPVNPKEAPGYTDRILFPMDLSLIRKMIVSRMIKSYHDLHQRIGLICHNCIKYNGRYVSAIDRFLSAKKIYELTGLLRSLS